MFGKIFITQLRNASYAIELYCTFIFFYKIFENSCKSVRNQVSWNYNLLDITKHWLSCSTAVHTNKMSQTNCWDTLL